MVATLIVFAQVLAALAAVSLSVMTLLRFQPTRYLLGWLGRILGAVFSPLTDAVHAWVHGCVQSALDNGSERMERIESALGRLEEGHAELGARLERIEPLPPTEGSDA